MIKTLWSDFTKVSEDKLQVIQLMESPYIKKIPSSDFCELVLNASYDSELIENKVMQKFSGDNLSEILLKENLNVNYDALPISKTYISLGTFETPNNITINKSFQSKDFYFKDEGVPELLFENWQKVVIAHELFHYFSDKEDNLFVKKYRIPLWKVGFYTHKTAICALEEIAASIFARNILNLNYYPFLLNLFLPAGFFSKAVEKRLLYILDKVEKGMI